MPRMNDATTPPPDTVIHGWHAHVYFNADTLAQARTLCEAAAAQFPLKMGRVHEKPVGPHPDWSCQLAFDPEYIGVVLPCLRRLPK